MIAKPMIMLFPYLSSNNMFVNICHQAFEKENVKYHIEQNVSYHVLIYFIHFTLTHDHIV